MSLEDRPAIGDDAAEMGTTSSKPITRGLVLSFDALGTLYRFRKPVAEQYLDVARHCGFTATIAPNDLFQSFRQAYKFMNTEHPNYGRSSLDSPTDWWNLLVNKTFRNVTREPLPSDLGSAMYEHFSSSAAYELYPDVKPLFARLHDIRETLNDDDKPILLTGVISNSDPRVKDVLQSLNLRCGTTEEATMQLDPKLMRQLAEKHHDRFRQTGAVNVLLPGHDFYNTKNDFDFVDTSYIADSEKPDRGIFGYARRMAHMMPLSRSMQAEPPTTSRMGAGIGAVRRVWDAAKIVDNLTWIHIGDDFEKDYIGAKEAGLEALHLVREGEGEPVKGARTVSSLDEVTALVNLIVANDYNVQE